VTYKKSEFLYEGKAKKLYSVMSEPNLLWVEFKDSLTAFNAQKKGSFEGKGSVNKNIATLIFEDLKKHGVESHFVKETNDNSMVVLKLQMLPVEVVVRNRAAGSLAKRFGLEAGLELRSPLFELYYKNDDLQDPLMSEEQALTLGIVESRSTLEALRIKALEINTILKALFASAGLDLIDFKLEFGKSHSGELLLADEITPDSCRLWDMNTQERYDKDRFRLDLGKVDESYQEVLKRLREIKK
jgi:phosphoribosylaminoimidazole-succinocarboxamide synthase